MAYIEIMWVGSFWGRLVMKTPWGTKKISPRKCPSDGAEAGTPTTQPLPSLQGSPPGAQRRHRRHPPPSASGRIIPGKPGEVNCHDEMVL